MEQMEHKIKGAQADVEHCRKAAGLPPVDEFVTMIFAHGFVTMPAEEFKKLSARKRSKLLKGGKLDGERRLHKSDSASPE